MFCPLTYRDILLISRGLLILIVAVIVGVSVTQQQLNSLTHRQESIQIFDMNRDNSGLYYVSVFGCSYSVNAVVPVAEIVNEDQHVDIKTAIYTLHIPKVLHVDCRKELLWLALQVNWLEQFTREVCQKINVYISQFR